MTTANVKLAVVVFTLFKFVNLNISKNEKREPNEFLRILDNGYKIKTVKFKKAEISLDTYKDLKILKKIIKKNKIIYK